MSYPKATFKTLAQRFAKAPGALPSDFVEPSVAKQYAEEVRRELSQQTERFGVRVHGTGEYPLKLSQTVQPRETIMN